MVKATFLLPFAAFVTFLHLNHALRGALVRVGRSSSGAAEAFVDNALAESPDYRVHLKPLPRRLGWLQLLLTSADDQSKLHRFGRSLYGVDSSSAIMRSQRGLLQAPEEQRSVIVIDADDGQLMRYGKR